jgi:3-phenylpropionate/trans-cinnamate dioxygenase ferredoxin reductase component
MSADDLRDVVVVGASAAGLTAAEALRREGYTGRLTLVGAEDRLPYDRPPLSKHVLSGAWQPDRTELRGAAALEELDAQWSLGVAATGLDLAARRVGLANGTQLPFGGLVIATGVRPRRLPEGHDLAGVHLLRTLDDALALRAALERFGEVVIVGAGFLGSEVAAVARELDCTVTLVDPLPHPMVRQFGPVVGQQLGDLHRAHGVRVRTGTGLREIAGLDGRVVGVELSDGERVPCDVVLVAIGSDPATGWLAGSGLTIGDGVECDSACVAAPGVVACGDVASWVHPAHGRMRVEHRMNATEQGVAAAKALLGRPEPFAPVPYFWTDQYDVKVQVHGHVTAGAEFRIVEGDPAGGRFAGVYAEDGRTVAALAWNMPKQARLLRAAVVSGELPAD